MSEKETIKMSFIEIIEVMEGDEFSSSGITFDTWKCTIDYLQKKINTFQGLEKDKFPIYIGISIYFEDGLIHNMNFDYFYSEDEESQIDGGDRTNIGFNPLFLGDAPDTPEVRKFLEKHEIFMEKYVIPEKFNSLFL